MKLTMVSLWYRGRALTRFIPLPMVDGRSVLPESTLGRLLDELGYTPGTTFSLDRVIAS